MTQIINLTNKIANSSWTVGRIINNYYEQTQGSFKGDVKFAFLKSSVNKINVGIKYTSKFEFTELGLLKYGNKTFTTSQTYNIFSSEYETFVLRSSGSLFFRFSNFYHRQNILHKCGHDMYLGRLFFINDRSFCLIWKVKGPKKHYYSRSIYKKKS